MERKLVLLSSSCLLQRLQEAALVQNDFYAIGCENKQMTIQGCAENILVETRSTFYVEVPHKRFNQLINFLKALSDQPLTLDFGDADWGIYIREAVI